MKAAHRSKQPIFRTLHGRLISSFLAVISVGTLVAILMAVCLVNRRVIAEVRQEVRHDLSSARMVYDRRRDSIVSVMELTSQRFFVKNALQTDRPDELLKEELTRIRKKYGLDYLTVTDAAGTVVARTRYPHHTGDDRSANPLVGKALEKQVLGSTEIVSGNRLKMEGGELGAQAFLVPIPTPRAKPQRRAEQNSGMVLEAAAPILDDSGHVLGVLYGGMLLSRNYDMVDRICNMVYGQEQYKGKPVGSATIFKWDKRISTTIKTEAGARAIGTRVSSDVYDSVLENGERWVRRAFVVNDWYIAGYEPIRNSRNEVIGMLYVGLLEQPYVAMKRNLISAALAFAGVGMAMAVGVAWNLGNSISRPVAKLVRGTERIAEGDLSYRVPVLQQDEIGRLANSFNSMTKSLAEIIDEKDRLYHELEQSDRILEELNDRYLKLLGFLTHEFIQPLTVLRGYLAMLEDGTLGPVSSSKQQRAIRTMHRNVKSMADMTGKYLNWSKIESGELDIRKQTIQIYGDIVAPVTEDMREQLAHENMILTIDSESLFQTVRVNADPSLIGIVYGNLLGNAVKYGRESGAISCGVRENHDFYYFNVRNEGEGIPESELDHVFGKFVRLNNDPRAKIKGTGLGLFNVKVIIEEHGGRIWAESVEGEWTNFVFTLPKT